MRKLILFIALLLPSALLALEGKWTPQQVVELDPAWLREQGLQIPPERLWDPKRGTGLLAATISTGGCSGGFISPDGLFITNHHCLFGVLQEHATPQNDIIANGFLAKSRDQELRSKTVKVTVPRRFTDVTAQILAAIPKKATDAQRHKAIEKKQNEIVAECEKQANARCRVAAHDGGVQYVLQETVELPEMRLVYAPPRAVGEYGGEIDNWMWPRHTGDFAIGRVYTADGQPYKPEFFFPLSRQGVKPGDFIMVLGYPGTTYRALTANEMTERHVWFERRRDLYKEWIDLLESTSKDDPAGRIAVADLTKTLANRQKNAAGQLEGFRRGRLLDKQRAADRAVLQNAPPAAKTAYDELGRMAVEQKKTFDHDFLLDQLRMTPQSLAPVGPKALVFALAIARAATERQKPDADRDPTFMERNIKRVRDRLERDQKSFFQPADRAVLQSFLRFNASLPEDQRVKPLNTVFINIYDQTRVFDLAERLKMFDETPAQLHARRDPLIELGFALNRELDEYLARRDRWEGMISRLRPEWRRAVIAAAGKPVAPDANSTLRVSFGHMQGYSPRDGVMYTPTTTLGGVIDKHTGEEPFDVPESIRNAAEKNAQALDIPINFLSDADTTGGNSGSPTVNGKGELVGVNFDRVWENVSNDFGYNQPTNRNINVDVRYLLWLLEQMPDAASLRTELGVSR